MRLVDIDLLPKTIIGIGGEFMEGVQYMREMLNRLPVMNSTPERCGEWISVKDGWPELISCKAGTAYSEAVNVLTAGRKVLTAIWDGFEWICDAEFWDAEDEEITHWTPILLPLPNMNK